MAEFNALARIREDPWETFLRRVTYKPGWMITYDYDIDRDNRRLIVEMRVEDSYNPGRMITVSSINHKVPRFDDVGEEAAMLFLQQIIGDLEMHERDEWFKVDGKLVHNPHMFDTSRV